MLLGKLAVLGNSFFWVNSLSEQNKFAIGTVAEYLIALGIIGLIKLMHESIENEFEAMQNARHTMLVEASHESDWGTKGQQQLDEGVAATGVGLRSMFLASNSSSTALWVKRILQSDGVVEDEDLSSWCNTLSRHQDACHIKYFAALLRKDTAMAAEISGIRPLVIFRLLEALESPTENPWQATSLSLKALSKKLEHNHIFMSLRALESVFSEIDSDSSGKITELEFMSWMKGYRPKNALQKRRHVLRTMFTSSGFWCLVAPVAGLFFVVGPGHLWPKEGLGGLSTATSAEVAYALFLVGAAENMRQAWHAQAYEYDEYEQAELELKSSIECITDALEASAVATKLAAGIAITAFTAARRIAAGAKSLFNNDGWDELEEEIAAELALQAAADAAAAVAQASVDKLAEEHITHGRIKGAQRFGAAGAVGRGVFKGVSKGMSKGISGAAGAAHKAGAVGGALVHSTGAGTVGGVLKKGVAGAAHKAGAVGGALVHSTGAGAVGGVLKKGVAGAARKASAVGGALVHSTGAGAVGGVLKKGVGVEDTRSLPEVGTGVVKKEAHTTTAHEDYIEGQGTRGCDKEVEQVLQAEAAGTAAVQAAAQDITAAQATVEPFPRLALAEAAAQATVDEFMTEDLD
jgi:hypothetical protein